MAYVQKVDQNNRVILSGISKVSRVDLDSSATGDHVVTVPFGAFSVNIIKCSAVIEVSFNGGDFIPMGEGASLEPFVDLESVTVKVTTASPTPTTIVFLS